MTLVIPMWLVWTLLFFLVLIVYLSVGKLVEDWVSTKESNYSKALRNFDEGFRVFESNWKRDGEKIGYAEECYTCGVELMKSTYNLDWPLSLFLTPIMIAFGICLECCVLLGHLTGFRDIKSWEWEDMRSGFFLASSRPCLPSWAISISNLADKTSS